MTQNFLQLITAGTREQLAHSRASADLLGLRQAVFDTRSRSSPHRLKAALSRKERTNIIAEIKRASPSKGVINDRIDPGRQAIQYASGGAAAVSVLTEPRYFKGSLEDLRSVREEVDLPLLRKDFIVDEVQILEAAAAGADAVLLIVAALSLEELQHLRSIIEDELNMDALVEVHTQAEVETAVSIGATIIGVNNRDLNTLTVSLDVSRELILHRPEGVLMVAESGISTREEMRELKALGFDGFLVGESLMRSGDAARTLEAWV